MWENTVITNAGIELLKNALSGGTITVTAVSYTHLTLPTT